MPKLNLSILPKSLKTGLGINGKKPNNLAPHLDISIEVRENLYEALLQDNTQLRNQQKLNYRIRLGLHTFIVLNILGTVLALILQQPFLASIPGSLATSFGLLSAAHDHICQQVATNLSENEDNITVIIIAWENKIKSKRK